MNALAILLALLVVGCGALADYTPAIDQAMERVAKVGGCVTLRCDFPPIKNCRVRPGRCQQ